MYSTMMISSFVVIAFFITVVLFYNQVDAQINTRFSMYEDDIHNVRMQFPSDWEQEKEYSDSIVRFVALNV
jgi:hypothetical protein